MKLNKLLCVLVLSLSITQLSAQVASDPGVTGPKVNPAPIPSPYLLSSGISVSFNFINAGGTEIPLNTLNGINTTLSNLAVNGTFSSATNIMTTGGDYFTFTYNPGTNTIVATQKAPIPAYAYQSITITGLKLTGESPRTNPSNGLNVNVAFLGSVNLNKDNDNISEFTYTVPGGSLPIRLLSFNGIKGDNSVQLKWQTSSEQNSSYFDVEFSTNGSQWTSIGKVNAAGTSSTERNYSLLHNTPVDGTNYYRLKQYDKNGGFAYSNIVPINFTIKGVQIGRIFPNPFIERIRVDISSDRSETVRVQLSDNVGRILKVQTFPIQKGVNQLWLESLGGLTPGIYNVEVKTAYTTYRVKLKK